MKARLKQNAPWETQKFKAGIILNKIDFLPIEDMTVQEQLKNSPISVYIEIEGISPIETPKKKRILKEEKDLPIVQEKEIKQEKASKTDEEISKLLEEGNSNLVLKSELKNLLLKRDYTEEDLKGLNKARLVEVFLIDKL